MTGEKIILVQAQALRKRRCEKLRKRFYARVAASRLPPPSLAWRWLPTILKAPLRRAGLRMPML
jgi:hypothetical protein